MILDELSKKYFKLVTKNKKSESPSRITCNCIMCGDKKNRLSLSAVDDDTGVCRCFNAGCTLNDQALPFPLFLKMADVSLYERYRREKFNKNLGRVDNLNNLLDINSHQEKARKAKKVKDISKEVVINLPETFSSLIKLEDSIDAIKYVEGRNIKQKIYKDWYFSQDRFIKVLDKTYFVEDYIFIPIIQNNKLSGFYTRSIREKRFSTILFPNREKYWSSQFVLDDSYQFYIFEGIFDALSCELDTIAMLSADLSEEVLEKIKDPVFVLDNDLTGILKSLKYVDEGFRVFIWPDNIYEKDMNEVLLSGKSRVEITKIIEDNIYSGFEAQIKLKMKRK